MLHVHHDPSEEVRYHIAEDFLHKSQQQNKTFQEESKQIVTEPKKSSFYFGLLIGVSIFSPLIIGGSQLLSQHQDKATKVSQFIILQREKEYLDKIDEIKERVIEKRKLEERLILAMTKLRFVDQEIEELCKQDKASGNSAYWAEKRDAVYSNYISIFALTELTFGSEIFQKALDFSKAESAKDLCNQDLLKDAENMRLKQFHIRKDMEINIKADLDSLKKEREKLKKSRRENKYESHEPALFLN